MNLTISGLKLRNHVKCTHILSLLRRPQARQVVISGCYIRKPVVSKEGVDYAGIMGCHGDSGRGRTAGELLEGDAASLHGSSEICQTDIEADRRHWDEARE